MAFTPFSRRLIQVKAPGEHSSSDPFWDGPASEDRAPEDRISGDRESDYRAVTRKPAASIFGSVEDEELVGRMLRGDSWAKEAFYRKHVAQAFRVARRLVGTRHDAEDVVQEAFAQAFVDLPHLRDPHALRGWFLRIVVNRAHRKFRRRKVLSFFGWGAEFEWDGYECAPECSPEVSMELQWIQEALLRVPSDARACWVLRRVEGCSLSEVAEACELSLATVKRKISLVDQSVSEHVAQAGGTE